MNIVRHYGQLWHFLRRRYVGDEYDEMRGYFANVLIDDLRKDFGLSLEGSSVLEVGGGSGRFSTTFTETCGSRCVNVEIEDMCREETRFAATVRGDGTALPVRNNSFDVVLCRGVIEHVPQARQLALIEECFRVVKPGGYCLINTQPWYSPFAGHQLRPFHMLPFSIAKRLSNAVKPSSVDANSLDQMDPPLYPITMRRLDALVKASGFDVRGAKDYHFRLHFVTRLPWLREVLTQSISYVLQKGHQQEVSCAS